ncbi:Response regulator UvrY [compost metagenome]
MLKTGVAAFLPKGVSPNELVQIIRKVHEKGFFFMADQMDVIREHLSIKSPKLILEQGNELSNREIDVLRLLCKQKTAKEIGELLFITQRTVEGHKNNLFVKTGAKNIAGLVIYSIQHNVIRIEDLPAI